MRNLVRYALPDGSEFRSLAQEEPWIFDFMVDFKGKPCHLELVRGAKNPFTEALSAAIMGWGFTPFSTSHGISCYRTRLFAYLREMNGKSVVLIPGVNDKR